jgi:hypothetical protein
MPRKKWVHDGPRQSQGYGHSWVILQTILRMSAAHGKARKETAVLWQFYHDHPECVPTQRELEHIPPEKFIEHANDLRRRFEAERARLKAVLRASKEGAGV